MKLFLLACIKADVKQLLLTKRDPGCLLNTWENEQSRSLIFDAPSFLHPVLSSVGVKARSGKEDTTLLSMADCRVKQETVPTATRYGIKPRIQGCSRGSVRMGGQRIRYHKKKCDTTWRHSTSKYTKPSIQEAWARAHCNCQKHEIVKIVQNPEPWP